ncbi:hypothetical protein ACFSHQ_21655 [Gemmobacter lanyuensis]
MALRDADMIFDTLPTLPQGTAMILRTDRRLGFDPVQDWQLQVRTLREHGMFQPEIGSVTFNLPYAAPPRFSSAPRQRPACHLGSRRCAAGRSI